MSESLKANTTCSSKDKNGGHYDRFFICLMVKGVCEQVLLFCSVERKRERGEAVDFLNLIFSLSVEREVLCAVHRM